MDHLAIVFVGADVRTKAAHGLGYDAVNEVLFVSQVDACVGGRTGQLQAEVAARHVGKARVGAQFAASHAVADPGAAGQAIEGSGAGKVPAVGNLDIAVEDVVANLQGGQILASSAHRA